MACFLVTRSSIAIAAPAAMTPPRNATVSLVGPPITGSSMISRTISIAPSGRSFAIATSWRKYHDLSLVFSSGEYWVACRIEQTRVSPPAPSIVCTQCFGPFGSPWPRKPEKVPLENTGLRPSYLRQEVASAYGPKSFSIGPAQNVKRSDPCITLGVRVETTSPKSVLVCTPAGVYFAAVLRVAYCV